MNIFVPMDIEGSFAKSGEFESAEGDKDWYVRGFASTPDLDFQGEIVNPKGINIDYFVNHGYINTEHRQDTGYVIGLPTKNCYVDMEKGLFVEAKLFKDNKYAQEMWQLAKDIKKLGDDRRLGFSIEGKIHKRTGAEKNVLEELTITNVALTKSPANPHATWDMFMKSWTTGHDINPETQTDGGATRIEDLASSIVNLTYAVNIKDPIEYKELWDRTIDHLDENGDSGKDYATIALQLSRGLSRNDAKQFIESLE